MQVDVKGLTWIRVDKMNGTRHDGMKMDKNGQKWRKQKKLGKKDENG